MTSDELKTEIEERFKHAYWGTKAWSAAFHTVFGVAAIAGVIVAAISGKDVKIGHVVLTDYVSLIAVVGSICSAIGGFGGFERKWKANRLTRNRLDILGLKLKNGGKPEMLTEELVEILRMHDAGILQIDPKPAA